MNEKLTYVIAVDRYDQNSGGNQVRHKLAEILHDLGEEVYTFGVGKPGYKYKILDLEYFDPETSITFNFPDEINIYTKLNLDKTVFIESGNLPKSFIKKNNVIRWQCWFCDDQDLIDEYFGFYFQFEGYNRNNKKCDGTLSVSDFDIKYWNPNNSNKIHNTFQIKKFLYDENNRNIDFNDLVIKTAKNLSIYSIQKDYKCIDMLNGSPYCTGNEIDVKNKAMRELLRQSDYFLSFDPITGNSLLAALCGAKSLIIPPSNYKDFDRVYTPEEFREAFFIFKYGIAYGINDIPHMIKTQKTLFEKFHEFDEKIVSDVKKLIKDCEKKIL